MTAVPKPEPGSGEADYSPRKAMQIDFHWPHI
jgi:hypothetical protein